MNIAVIQLTIADLFINLSAGWFGAAFLILVGTKKRKTQALLLTINLSLAILTLIVAIELRSSNGL